MCITVAEVPITWVMDWYLALENVLPGRKKLLNLGKKAENNNITL